MKAPPLRLVAALLAGMASAAAAEPVVRDLTLDLELLPADFDFHFRSAGTAATADDAFDSAIGVAVGYRHGWNRPGSRHGLIAGAQLTSGLYTYDASDSDYRTFGLRATVGYGLALDDRWKLLIEPMLEFGVATWDFSSPQSFSVSGDYLRFGIESRVAFAITDHWIANLHLGWMTGTSDLGGDGRTLEVDHQGPLIGLGIAYRFSAAPSRLE